MKTHIFFHLLAKLHFNLNSHYKGQSFLVGPQTVTGPKKVILTGSKLCPYMLNQA